MTDAEIRKDIIVNTDILKARKAIEIASSTEREDLLLVAMNNPNWDIRTTAINAISNLPVKKSKVALLTILKNDNIWSNRTIFGGEAQIVQDHFAVVVLESIHKVFEVEISSVKLFDVNSRKALIATLEK